MNGSSENTKKKKLKRKMEEVDQKMMSASDSNNMIYKNQDANMLPGYRFHPTDEELVRFYLRRKVENKPIRLDLIKHVDIYKYDPWDLPSKLLRSIPSISNYYILFPTYLHAHDFM